MSARLIVSVSGIRDTSVDQAANLADELDRRSIPVSLLVAPRRGHGYRLADDQPTQQWLHARRDRGDAIVLGGYDEAATKRRRPEFAVVDAAEAAVRLTAADRLMTDLGMRTRLFAPPRWNASPGCLEALPLSGFRLCANTEGIHDLTRGTTERGRVLSLGEGFAAESWWAKALVAAAGRTAKAGGLVRLNVSAKHLGRKGLVCEILDAVDLVVEGHGARALRYEWTPEPMSCAA